MKVPRAIVIILAFLITVVGAVVAGTSASAAPCVTSIQFGTCGPYNDPFIYSDNGNPLVIQDVWNPSANWHQTLTATNAEIWSVAANMAAGNKAVVSYPDTQVTLTLSPGVTPPLSLFGTSLMSTYAQGDPAGSGQDYEWAYDLWLSPQHAGAWNNDTEFMIWTDNHGQTPGGSNTGVTYTAPDGVQYELWLRGPGSNSSAYGTITLVRKINAQFGSVDIDAAMNWLKFHGYVAASASFDQIDYGLEISSTGGMTRTYPLTNYTVVVNGTAPPPPPPPSPVPTGLSQTAHVIVNFGWHPVAKAKRYEFQLDTVAGVLVTDRYVSGANVGGVEVAKDTRYRWRVRVAGGTWSAWTPFVSP
jgi:hypothetical protein